MNVGSDLLEQAVQLVTNDNLDLGCAVIEQAATEKVRLLPLIYRVFCAYLFIEQSVTDRHDLVFMDWFLS